MSVITARQFEEALRDWLGDRVVFRDGWATRDSNGGFDPHGTVHHWTAMRTTGPHAVAPANQERLLAVGRSGLPGPLCHLTPRRNGVVAVIAGPHANANHAGDGDPDVYRRVLAGRFDGTPAANQSTLDGNPLFYGFEYQFHPDDGTMPDAQFEAGILAAAALAQAHGWTPDGAAGSQLDHYEWTPRKWDREVQNLANRTREGVRLALRNHAQEDDMPYLDWPQDDRDALLNDIRRELHGGERSRYKRLRNDLADVRQALESIEHGEANDATRAQARRANEKLDELLGDDGAADAPRD